MRELLKVDGKDCKNLDRALSLEWLERLDKMPGAVLRPRTEDIGSTDPKRIQELTRADERDLSREEWYQIYLAAGNQLP